MVTCVYAYRSFSASLLPLWTKQRLRWHMDIQNGPAISRRIRGQGNPVAPRSKYGVQPTIDSPWPLECQVAPCDWTFMCGPKMVTVWGWSNSVVGIDSCGQWNMHPRHADPACTPDMYQTVGCSRMVTLNVSPMRRFLIFL